MDWFLRNRMRRIEDALGTLIADVRAMHRDVQGMAELQEDFGMTIQELADQVQVVVGVEQSASVLLAGLRTKLDEVAAQLTQQGIDAAAIQAISDELGASSAALSAAVAANPVP